MLCCRVVSVSSAAVFFSTIAISPLLVSSLPQRLWSFGQALAVSYLPAKAGTLLQSPSTHLLERSIQPGGCLESGRRSALNFIWCTGFESSRSRSRTEGFTMDEWN